MCNCYTKGFYNKETTGHFIQHSSTDILSINPSAPINYSNLGLGKTTETLTLGQTDAVYIPAQQNSCKRHEHIQQSVRFAYKQKQLTGKNSETKLVKFDSFGLGIADTATKNQSIINKNTLKKIEHAHTYNYVQGIYGAIHRD